MTQRIILTDTEIEIIVESMIAALDIEFNTLSKGIEEWMYSIGEYTTQTYQDTIDQYMEKYSLLIRLHDHIIPTKRSLPEFNYAHLNPSNLFREGKEELS